MPMPNFGTSLSASRLNFAISSLASEPRTPSPISTYLPRSSMPRVKLAFGLPSRPTPMSPVATPTTRPSSS
jgi:hypothetical protein